MDQIGLIVLGAVVAALATGGVRFYGEYRSELLSRKVAARVLLGDLYIVEALADTCADRKGGWNHVDWKTPVESWEGSREALAASMRASEWVIVDTAFRHLAEVAGSRQGEPLRDPEIRRLRRLAEATREARGIVLPHAASRRERDELVRELSTAWTGKQPER